jgi:hypothetical protein
MITRLLLPGKFGSAPVSVVESPIGHRKKSIVTGSFGGAAPAGPVLTPDGGLRKFQQGLLVTEAELTSTAE